MNSRLVRRCLLGFFLFAFVIYILQILRNRSFWLDEAMIFDTLRSKSAWEILFGGPLSYVQAFPKVYLSIIRLVMPAGPETFSTRLLPLGFGLGGVAAWLWCFYEFYGRRLQDWNACLISGGLLIANAYTLYYGYELKQYSAEFCFSGLLVALYQTDLFSERKRLLFIAGVAILSLLFTYTGLFVGTALVCAVLFDKQERSVWIRHPRIVFLSLITASLLIAFLYGGLSLWRSSR